MQCKIAKGVVISCIISLIFSPTNIVVVQVAKINCTLELGSTCAGKLLLCQLDNIPFDIAIAVVLNTTQPANYVTITSYYISPHELTKTYCRLFILYISAISSIPRPHLTYIS